MRSMTHDTWNPEALRARLQAYPPYAAGAGVLVTHIADDAKCGQRSRESREAGCECGACPARLEGARGFGPS